MKERGNIETKKRRKMRWTLAILASVSLVFWANTNAPKMEASAMAAGMQADATHALDEAKEGDVSKTIKTETLDWFSDDVSLLIPVDAVFTMKDVKTGKTFTAIRCSGKSHLDAEPASADDTAAFKKLLGGKWRWLGRPALLLYDGRVFAVSMCGKPHGTKTIKGNNFQGHFCIHFKNSRTHANDKVIRGYQNAVALAGQASWFDLP